jgi:hypothetical protein
VTELPTVKTPPAREAVRPGQRLEFHEEDGRLVATKGIPDDDVVAASYGILRLPDAVDALIDELHDPHAPRRRATARPA